MTLSELGFKLREIYESGKNKGETAEMVHLFAIKYAKAIQSGGYTAKEILNAAQISEGYQAEISKGVKLAQYVVLKDDIRASLQRVYALTQ